MYDVTCFLYILYVITPPRSNIPCEDMLDIPMAVDDKRDGANSLSAVRLRNFQEHRIWQACFRAKASQQSTQQASRAALLDGECLRATIKDCTKARGQRPQNRGNACAPASHAAMLQCAWELGLVAGYALREREVVGSIPAVPHRTSHT